MVSYRSPLTPVLVPLTLLLPNAKTRKDPIQDLFDVDIAKQLIERLAGLAHVMSRQHGVSTSAEVGNCTAKRLQCSA